MGDEAILAGLLSRLGERRVTVVSRDPEETRRLYRAEAVGMREAAPALRRHRSVIIGGGGARRTPRLAATYADEFNMPFAPVEATTEQFGRVREAAERGGRRVRLSAAQVLCVGRDDAELQRRAAAIGRELDEQGVLDAGLAIEERAGFTARPERWW